MKLAHKKFPIWLIALLLVVIIVIATLVYGSWSRVGRTHITAYFDTSVGVSEGTDISVLGVKVGSVEEVIPRGDQVEVKMFVNRGVDIPADAKAAQITPSVIPDRYIQLLPAYTGGPKMEDGAVLERDRTSTPVEVDRLYKSLQDLSTALGPEGVNEDGTVNRFLDTSARTLGENGRALGDSIDQLSQASTTLADSRQDLAGTVTNLQSFVSMLAENDQQVRTFNDQMAQFNQTVANQRENLQSALGELSWALADVARLVRDNQDVIQRNAEKLATVGGVTADHTEDIQEILVQAPLALTNLIEGYDADSGTLQMRLVLHDSQSPANVLCKMMQLNRLQPGNPLFEDLTDEAGIKECQAQIEERNAFLKDNVELPTGIMTAELAQTLQVPGAVPGVEGFNQPPASERSPR